MKVLTLRFLFFLLFVFLFNSCENSGIGQFDEVVVENENNRNKFRQITFIISLTDSENGYLNLGVIDSLEVFINGNYWGTFSSEQIDMAGKTVKVVENIPYSDELISYLFVAPYKLKTDKLETAGDFVKYLQDRIVLTPGEYVAEIKKIKFKDGAGEWVTRKTQIFVPFSVEENKTSSYIGNIIIPVE